MEELKMKLAKKFGLLVATTVAAIGLTSVAYGFGQKDAGATYVKVNFWNEGDINYPDEIDYQYCSDKSFAASKTKDFKRVEGKSIYTIEDLDPGQSYWVRYRESGMFDYSSAFEVVTTPRFADESKITQVSAAANSATFTWTAAAGATGYRIMDEYNEVIQTVSTNKATIKLSKGALYKVEPIRKASTGSFVATKGANDLNAWLRNAPSVPKNITFRSELYVSGDLLKFKWDGSEDVKGYEFEYSLYNGKKKVVEECEYAEKVIYSKNQFYRVRIRSFWKNGNKKFYSAWSKYKYLCQDTAGIVKLKATSGKKKKIKISWKTVKGAKKYIVYMAKGNDAGYKKIKTTKKKSLVIDKFKKKKLKKGAEYYFKVIAVGKFNKKTVKSENRTYNSVKID